MIDKTAMWGLIAIGSTLTLVGVAGAVLLLRQFWHMWKKIGYEHKVMEAEAKAQWEKWGRS